MSLVAADLLGTWLLESCEGFCEGEPTLHPLGEHPTGTLLYSPDGWISVAIMREKRTLFAADDILKGSEAEKARAAETYLSYSGRWTLDGDRVKHDVVVSLFPNWIGGRQERRVQLEGGRLTLSTDPIDFGGRSRRVQMSWRRPSSAG
jgi:Lipocalin-like domain